MIVQFCNLVSVLCKYCRYCMLDGCADGPHNNDNHFIACTGTYFHTIVAFAVAAWLSRFPVGVSSAGPGCTFVYHLGCLGPMAKSSHLPHWTCPHCNRDAWVLSEQLALLECASVAYTQVPSPHPPPPFTPPPPRYPTCPHTQHAHTHTHTVRHLRT
jgi:hypothetical protein